MLSLVPTSITFFWGSVLTVSFNWALDISVSPEYLTKYLIDFSPLVPSVETLVTPLLIVGFSIFSSVKGIASITSITLATTGL